MYNNNFTVDLSLIIIELEQIDSFFKRNIPKKHPAHVVKLPRHEYRELLAHPTPEFYKMMYERYLCVKRDICFNRYYQFKNKYNYGVSKAY